MRRDATGARDPANTVPCVITMMINVFYEYYGGPSPVSSVDTSERNCIISRSR